MATRKKLVLGRLVDAPPDPESLKRELIEFARDHRYAQWNRVDPSEGVSWVRTTSTVSGWAAVGEMNAASRKRIAEAAMLVKDYPLAAHNALVAMGIKPSVILYDEFARLQS